MSSGRKARRTSEAVGRLMRSGIAHLGFTPHTVLSKTRRGSLPSARTMLSFPTATPLGQCRLACSMDMLVRNTRPFAISFSVYEIPVRFSGFPVADALGEFTRQVCLGVWRPLHAAWQLLARLLPAAALV